MCYYCLKFGHIIDKCTAKQKGEGATCYKCAGEHEGNSCRSASRKCSTCAKAKRPDNHSVTSTACPGMMAELRRIEENTDHGFGNDQG